MAKLSTIQDVVEQEDDTLVYVIRGTITNVWCGSNGENDNGPWSLQNIEIKDETGTMKVKLKNRPEVPKHDKGKRVEFACFHGEKGWSGVKAKDDTYKNKTTRILYVTGSAEMSFLEDGPGKPAATPPAKSESQQRTQPQRQPDHEPATTGEHPLAGPRSWFMQWANGYVLAFDAANYAATQIESRTGRKLSVSDIKDVATSASIGFQREMNIAALPTHPLPPPRKPKAEPAQEPEPPQPPPKPPEQKPPPPAAKKDYLPQPDDPEDDIPF